MIIKPPVLEVSFLHPERVLFGIDTEKLNLCVGSDKEKRLIINNYLTISIGLIFFIVKLNIKMGES
jgi:hypothetical protein